MNFFRGKRIVICGAGGFIGGHLMKHLSGHSQISELRGVDIKPINEWFQRCEDAELISADLRSKEACERAVQGMDIVFNLAADMGGMGFIETNKAACMLNVLINTHLLMASRNAGAERYFYSSSACVYAADKQVDPGLAGLKEIDAYPAMPEDGYGWEKLFSERMCRHFREDYGLQTRAARYHNVYGPWGSWDGGREKAPAAICRKIAQSKLSGNNQIEIWGDGSQTRSFTYIDDCIQGTLKIAASAIVDPINLGSAEKVSIEELIKLVEDIADIHLNRFYILDAPHGVNGRNSDNSLIRTVLGWEPKVALKDGMKYTYDWIYDQVCKRYAMSAIIGK